jgi:hypothetical protein
MAGHALYFQSNGICSRSTFTRLAQSLHVPGIQRPTSLTVRPGVSGIYLAFGGSLAELATDLALENTSRRPPHLLARVVEI